MAKKTGMSAQNLKEAMGLGSYRTAWGWLHKLRRAMIRPGRDQLKGEVEVDETYIGGVAEGGPRGRGAEGKVLVVVAVESQGKKAGRVRFRCIPEASWNYLLPFIEDTVELGSTIITDGWDGYSGLKDAGYQHDIRVIRQSPEKAHELLPHVHRVDSLVKKWINGTHQGNVHPKHLPYYLDEYAFRFNRRMSHYRGNLFYRLIQQAVNSEPEIFRNIVGGNKKPPRRIASISEWIQSIASPDQEIWALKKIRHLDPVVKNVVKNLADLKELRYIKIKTHSIQASTELDPDKQKRPNTALYHESASSIHIVFDFDKKTMEFFEINSNIKDFGTTLISSALTNFSNDWKAVVVFNYNPEFWKKVMAKHPSIQWLRI